MELRERIQEDMKQAMRDKQELTRDTLRMVKADLDRKELDLGRPLDAGETLDVITRAVKTRRESVEQYDAGGRKDLADKERAEIAIVERYLPKALTEAEAREALKAIVAELGLAGKKDMGKLMKEVSARYRGQIEGKLASTLAGEVLG